MPYDVKATPIAVRQIAALRGPRRKAFDSFMLALAVEGCKALGYRLTGANPLPQFCVKHLRGSDRVVVAFVDETAWVLLVGRHEAGDRQADIYTALYAVAGLERPESPRTKPPCCDDEGAAPILDEFLIDKLVKGARATVGQ